MSLIECPECGREVSSNAAACPKCAYPVMTGTPPVPSGAVKRGSKRDWVIPGLSIVARLGVGMILIGVGADEQSGAAVTGGLIVGGSAIPTFFFAWRDRLKLDSAQRGPELTAGLEDRMAEMEYHHREQMADLEERVDFAERLLTKQRDQIGPG